MHFFGGDQLGGWIIPLLDLWSLINPLLKDFNVAAWCPVDHFPVPPGVLRFFERTEAVPLAMSRFGERQLTGMGLDPVYVPLSVDTRVYKPTPSLSHPAHGDLPARTLMGVPEDAFVVGMVAMNKDANDRKGFNEAFASFGAFWREHNDAVLYCHSDWKGMGTSFDLKELATHCGIPPHAIVFPDTYAYQTGFTSEMMAAAYTGMDVLLAPSHGEGFCVPLIEAQACGTPVIVTDFSAQPELMLDRVTGWKVLGQQQWDPAQHAFYIVPFINDIVRALEASYRADRAAMAPAAVAFASQYDTEVVFDQCWRPFIASLEAGPEPLELDRSDPFEVAVIVPAMRPENLPRLRKSFDATNDGSARLVVVGDAGLEAHVGISTDADATTYAEKVNLGYSVTSEPWVLLVGDDVEFKPGWIEAARKLSDTYDVIGTNDSSGAPKNPEVAAGRHADHFFVRRAYVEEYGASLDGPGILAPDCYRHWFVDREMVELAKVRGVFAPCLEAVVEHHHPGYDGREDLRESDPVYMTAVASARSSSSSAPTGASGERSHGTHADVHGDGAGPSRRRHPQVVRGREPRPQG
jgi:glycosyltransferase involved in cell wall biosynthesis